MSKTLKEYHARNATVSVLVKLLPYLISSLGLHAVFIFHGWELTIWVCSPSFFVFCFSVLFDLSIFLSVLFDLSVFCLFCLTGLFFLSVLFNLSVLQVSWARNCNDFAKGQFVHKKLFLWVLFVSFVLFACYVWFCLLCVFCKFISSARTFNNFAQGGLCTGSSFCLVLCAGDKRKNSFSARFNLQKRSSSGKRC